MKKKLNLLSAIIVALTVSNVHAMESNAQLLVSPEEVSALIQTANREAFPGDRGDAIKTLIQLGGESQVQAEEILSNIVRSLLDKANTQSLNPYYRLKAANDLACFGEDAKIEGAKILLHIIEDTNTDIFNKKDAAGFLEKFGSGYEDYAKSAWFMIMKMEDVYPAAYIADAAAALIRLKDPRLHEIEEVLKKLLSNNDNDMDAYSKVQTANDLAKLGG